MKTSCARIPFLLLPSILLFVINFTSGHSSVHELRRNEIIRKQKRPEVDLLEPPGTEGRNESKRFSLVDLYKIKALLENGRLGRQGEAVDVAVDSGTGILSGIGNTYGQALATNVLDIVASSLTGNLAGIVTGSLRIFQNPGTQGNVQGLLDTISGQVAGGLNAIGFTTEGPDGPSATGSGIGTGGGAKVSEISSSSFSANANANNGTDVNLVNAHPGQSIYVVLAGSDKNSQDAAAAGLVPVNSQVLPLQVPQVNLNVITPVQQAAAPQAPRAQSAAAPALPRLPQLPQVPQTPNANRANNNNNNNNNEDDDDDDDDDN